MREAIGADAYASSLRDAAAACLAAAREVENDPARGHLVELKTKRPPHAFA